MTYLELLQQFPPRPIYSVEDAEANQKVIDALLDRVPLTKDELDYLNVLGALVYEWETVKENLVVGGIDFELDIDLRYSQKIIRINQDGCTVASVFKLETSEHYDIEIPAISDSEFFCRDGLAESICVMREALKVEKEFDKIWDELNK